MPIDAPAALAAVSRGLSCWRAAPTDAREPPAPTVLLVVGAPGSGRSTLVRSALLSSGATVFAFDAVALSRLAPGDARGAIDLAFGRAAGAAGPVVDADDVTSNASAQAAGDVAAVSVPRPVALVFDDLDDTLPAPRRGLGGGAGGGSDNDDDDDNGGEAARAFVRHCRTVGRCRGGAPIAVICTVRRGWAHPLLARAVFTRGRVASVPPLTGATRGDVLVSAARAVAAVAVQSTVAPLQPSDGRAQLPTEAELRAFASDECAGFGPADLAQLVGFAAAARRAAQGRRGAAPRPLLETLRRLAASHVPAHAPFGGGRDARDGSMPGASAGGVLDRRTARRARRLLVAVPAVVAVEDFTPEAIARRHRGGGVASAGAACDHDGDDDEDVGGGGEGSDGDSDGDAASDSDGGGGDGAGAAGGALYAPPALAAALRPSPPSVAWGDVGGQDAAKAALHDVLLWPLAHAAEAAALGLPLPTGVLLYGPPGTGKTLLAKAAAAALGNRFITLPIPAILRPGVGDSERALAAAFAAARAAAPSVLFIDEVQALFGRRGGGGAGGGDEAERMATLLTSQLLQCMDRLRGSGEGEPGGGRVVIIAATNAPDALDDALLRPGRFDRCVHVGLPGAADRAAILEPLLRRMLSPPPAGGRRRSIGGVELGSGAGGDGDAAPEADAAALAVAVAARTAGFSGADLACVCQAAVGFALREDGAGDDEDGDGATVRAAHVWAAVASMQPSCPPQRVAALARWRPPR